MVPNPEQCLVPHFVHFRRFGMALLVVSRGKRIKDMEGSCTMKDVRRRANLKSIATYVGVGQLNYLGHIARLPSDRLEKQMLSAWLPTEATLLATKGLSTRQQFWQLKEVMELGQVENWQSQWYKVAAMEGGAVWTSLVRRRWQKHQRTLEDKMTWQQKHLPAGHGGQKSSCRAAVCRQW